MILIKTAITEERPFDVTSRAWPKMKTLAMQTVGNYWHDKLMPKHFEYSAKNRYNYAKRTIGYINRKKKEARRGKIPAPGSVDLVYTGNFKQLVKTATIRAFPTRATVKMQAPRYITMRVFTGDRSAGFRYGKNRSQQISQSVGQQPDKKRELTATTPDEREKMEQLLRDTMYKLIKNFRAKRTVFI